MKWIVWVGNAVLLVSGLVVLLWSDAVRAWVSAHGAVLYVATLAVIAVCVVLAEAWWTASNRSPKVTERDRNLFAKLEQAFPLDSGAIAYLRDSFTGKAWTWTAMSNILDFADGWGIHARFDDARMEIALRTFHEAAHRFYSDAAGESHSLSESEPSSRRAVLKDSKFRPQYSPEWTATRERLRQEAVQVVDAFLSLYLLGRQRGL